MSDTPQIPEPDEGGRVEDFFRDQSVPQEACCGGSWIATRRCWRRSGRSFWAGGAGAAAALGL